MPTKTISFPEPEYHWAPERVQLYQRLVERIENHLYSNGPPLTDSERGLWAWVASPKAEALLADRLRAAASAKE